MSAGDPADVARRGLFRGAAGLGAVVSLPAAAQPAARAPQPSPEPGTVAAWRAGGAARQRPQSPPYRFLNGAEAGFIEAAVDRLIPDDDNWPGALWAGVPAYIDGQLAGAYGQGARFYASGPWAQGLPSQGYQLALNPSQLYRTSLAAILRDLGTKNIDFARATPEQRDAYLRDLENGRVDCGGFSSAYFFETLLANTIEGFFADPIYAGNRDMVGWRMIGFPGAYAAYLQLYTHHGMHFEREPLSIGHAHQAEGHGAGEHRHG
ncbi:gluconate 2-dehydrogenase subunit 3 family protein [Roseomonas chloroacetimidivorans]|jgi:gluconate 2-dehydrogenase gamma chain|uniref:gluconate 2-dehydrogenase subunit 3 family protein n=1 Tax=Roseomonas chloroacetimidivorans TaxID=1766656 RepID=UPI003C71D8B6